ncbi:MAG: 50S ribosomal protein L24 [Roseburia sp.]|nr:50S ribosomal protein L24 [Anaeroplasma bactoclasticum]MCM1195796.1 50S ribosomal protein L24 [Roseburia sp.]MCM1557304.1 50S ribosomal protein L24 [Anaeroplasma bactoclasticum]
MQIKTGDTVVVIAGKDKFTKDKKGNLVPTTGKVLRVYPKTNRVVVEGVNKITKHQKPTQTNQSGSKIEKEAPIDASNVMLLDPKVNKPTRVSIKIDENGKKIRVSKKSDYEFK